MAAKMNRDYPLHDRAAPLPPDYHRVARALSDEELIEEQRLGRGEPGYQEAVADEIRWREKEG